MVRPWLARRDFVFEIEPGILLQPGFADRILYWAFVDGRSGWDPIMDLSRALIGAGDVVFDVGANVGVWLLGAARRAGQTGSVHAFEPVVENLARLRAHLSLNGLDFVQIDPRVLSDEPGEVVFFPPGGSNSGMGSLVRHQQAAEPIRIAATTLDIYCREHGIKRIDFLKVDVEGAELLVFRGGADLLAAADAPAIMFEADDRLTAAPSSSTAATKRFLERCGYEIFHFTGARLESISPRATPTSYDLLAVKRYHFERHPFLRSYV